MYLEPIEHSDITYIQRTGERPPLMVKRISEGICQTVEVDEQDLIADLLKRRQSYNLRRTS